LPPLRLMMLTAPAEVIEVEGSSEERVSWNSLTESGEKLAVVVPPTSSVTSIPSICTRVVLPERPATDTPR
jgi:hypothetical protein